MENLICSCCGAKLVPTITTAFLTCEYCDSSVENPYYDASKASEAAKPDLTATALATLREMGVKQKLSGIDPDCFGEPLLGIDSARRGLSIPDGEQVWFLLAHNIIFLGFSDGVALTDSGLYYHCDSGEGSLSWQTFITSGIACVPPCSGSDGALQIGSGVRLSLKDDRDASLAAFLIDFHNQVYRAHTGEAAPQNWCVRQRTQTTAANTQEESTSFLDAALSGLGLLFGAGTARRTLTRSTTSHPTSRPTVRQDRRNHVEPPRPLHTQPHRRPAQPGTAKKLGSPGARIKPQSGSAKKISTPTASRIPTRTNAVKPGVPSSRVNRTGATKSSSPLASRLPARPGAAKKAPGSIARPRPSSSRPASGGVSKIGKPRRGGR